MPTNHTVNEVSTILSQLNNADLTNMCYNLCSIFKQVLQRIGSVSHVSQFAESNPQIQSTDPESGDIFDPESGDIFDPESGDIFDPGNIVSPDDGIVLRAFTEQIYDSYGNRIHPGNSEEVLLKLFSWLIAWRNYQAQHPSSTPGT
jgi:hypothetical protein